ncbi:hypothetical protein Mapa_008431 [Marchantia paleacea]|nr:hypothetical protein Mapa_008431 [Marchantia paleacea]
MQFWCPRLEYFLIWIINLESGTYRTFNFMLVATGIVYSKSTSFPFNLEAIKDSSSGAPGLA